MNETLEFNGQNSLYKILFEYVNQNEITVFEKKNNEISKNTIKTLILKKGVQVNSLKTYIDTHKVENGDRIQIPEMSIDFICVENKNIINESVENKPTPLIDKEDSKLVEIPIKIETSIENEIIDNFIVDFIRAELGCQNIEEIRNIDKKKALCYLIVLFEQKGFEEIKSSKYSYELTYFVKDIFTSSHLTKELDYTKNQINSDGKLVDLLIQDKIEIQNNLKSLNENLLNGHYDNSLFNYLRDYRKIYSSDCFQYLILPLLNNKVSSQIGIENLIKPVSKSFTIIGIDEKYNHYEISKIIFNSYFELLKGCDEFNNIYFFDITEYLYKLLKVNCGTAIEKAAKINVESTNRKYNFSNIERSEQEIFLVVSNDGEGLARNVSISSLSESFNFNKVNVGILKPNEKREVSIVTTIKFDCNFKPRLGIQFRWEEISGKEEFLESCVEFQIQKTEIPWEELKKKSPYSNSIIDSADKLYGRDEIIEELKSNILSDNIESYKLWGQKRVGKSSIVTTLKTIIDQEEKVIIVNRRLGGLRNTNAIETLNTLGESLCSEVYEEIDKKIKDPSNRERLRSIEIPVFNGSFLPLENYLKKLRRIDNSLKFVFILDEFDRINEEFFLPGNLGETLSLSIGKGLNENKYIGFILVGSENMHLLNKQAMNYNSYQEKEVDTFHKIREYKSFAQIVKGPTTPHINYSDEAIEKIFESSNGNPYFANLICSNIFKNAYKNKDNEIDVHSVRDAISLIINSSQKSHFEHFWGDGILDESNIKKERKADIRRRILVSFSMSSNPIELKYPNKGEISRSFKRPSVNEYELEKYDIENTITEFINRKIFIETDLAQIRILPKIFESWLCGSGRTLMIGGVSDLEELQREIDIEKDRALKPEELDRLSEKYYFKERTISIEKFSEFFKQFGGVLHQRRVFKLLDSIVYISKEEITAFYRKENKNIFPKTTLFLKENVKTIFKENIELYTFSKFFDENYQIVESFKLLNQIRKLKQLKKIKDDSRLWKKNGADKILIIEPIIESFSDIENELFLLLNDEIKNAAVSIRLITFIITTKAKADLITATSSFSNFKLIAYKEVEEAIIKPFIQGTEIFENYDESNEAFYEVGKLFSTVSKDSLLILFEDFCPSKSCPILWHKTSQFNPMFYNEFGTILNTIESDEGEKRRDSLYFSAKELSQKINRYMITYLVEKAKKEGHNDWFILKYIPRRTLDSVNKKWLDEGQIDPRESYFDFIDYKEIIKNIKDSELQKKFMIGEKEQYDWMNKCNELRRDPAHPEKPCPTIEEIEYFEKIKNQILPRLV